VYPSDKSTELLALGAVCALLFWSLVAYSEVSSPVHIRETEQILRGTMYIAVAAALLPLRLDYRFEALVFGSAFVAAVMLIFVRSSIRTLLGNRLRRERILLYLRQPNRELLARITTPANFGREFVGLILDSPWDIASFSDFGSGNLGSRNDLPALVRRTNASRLMVVGSEVLQEDVLSIREECNRLQLCCSFLLDAGNDTARGLQYGYVDDLPVATLTHSALSATWLDGQRFLDLIFGTILFLIATPLAVAIAVCVKADSDGPVFFRQQRIGKNGKPFQLWKFRTMYVQAPKYQCSPTSDSDPRLTRFGTILRRLSLDELPQLFNVLKGDMSLVGPRPEMPFIVEQYGTAERRRLRLRPGITGLWQISRARAMPIHHGLQYDLFYIEHHNAFLDLAILFRTLLAVIRGVGAT
jgi:exopolysaccharide biosynthesis polyprenyl glycosylphosphotransferase